jgi:dihydroorotase
MVATGQMSMERLAEVMSVAPARIAGLSELHGRPIAVGEPATFALVDPSARWTVDREASASLSRNNPWHGRSYAGRVVATLLRGRVTARGGVVVSAGE